MASLTDTSFSFYEPMRKNWFIVQFDGLSSGGDDEESLSIACKTCSIPQLNTSENAIHRINDIVYTPGKSEYQVIELSFYEFIKDKGDNGSKKNSAGSILYNWQQQIHRASSGVQGAKKSIAHNAAIVQIDGDGTPVRVWNVYNCWPTSVTFSGLDSSTGEVQDVQCTLRYDWAESTNYDVEIGKSN